MNLHAIDYVILVIFFSLTLWIGWKTMRKAGQSSTEFFLSGRAMPWWLLGFSLVATTFSADTPNLVTDIVRQNGVSGNWVWWAFLPTGMTTVFIYAKLWRKLGVMTDLEFYEVRYSGKSGAFLRGFRTFYLGLVVNTIIMASVTLAIIKIFGVMLGLSPYMTILFAGTITVIFTTTGGFSAVLWADFVLFIVAMFGSIAAAIIVLGLPEIGGLSPLLSHPEVVGKLSVFPDFSDFSAVLTLLVIPLAIQWWSAWYPGAEPGGGSYTAQRMLAAKNASHAIGATLFFNFCHYALRPWPWIIVALGSLICFPTLESLKLAFPQLPDSMIGHDMAYPAMMTKLPPGFFGIVVASLFAAYMSTIATHLNLGSSYMVNDLYHRFVNKNATEKELVKIGRIWTVLLMIFACLMALFLKNALDAFQILLMIGAGTGLLFLIRWFWWRVNAFSEIAAMCLALPIAIYFKMIHTPLWTYLMPVEMIDGSVTLPDYLNFSDGIQLVISVTLTTIGWVLVTFLTPPTDKKTLRQFIERTEAGGPGWKHVVEEAQKEGVVLQGCDSKWNVPVGILCSVIGCVTIYSALFGSGALLYGQYRAAVVLLTLTLIGSFVLLKLWKKLC
ncbi:MAG: sodium:solute symporter family protein [Planctomycetia bacterium]|nr:sodium:solute symporter family protein [Planctomycetia bacterium]